MVAEVKNLTSRYPVRDIDGKVIYKNRHYTNTDAVPNLLNFIVRGEPGEKVYGWNALGASDCLDVDAVIQQFLHVQEFYHINSRKGKRVYHEMVTIHDVDPLGNDGAFDWNALMEIAYEFAWIYFDEGYQVMFSLHWSRERGYHIHYAVNSVSFINNGRKFRTNKQKRMERENIFNVILGQHQFKRYGSLSEIPVLNDDQPSLEDVC